ncbi:HD domain-containing protein [Polaribacter sargassicola]|uniref:HD domain-containing protein n=1 Tax=Polaribacter sargassicola TaxID=2836891 RepID=UPI001F1FB112|nr:HD domain-containing protein [Polaribacter sp. DS7-9]MCG1035752.1 HD domain-containing protein [Polaribacter sp. DS7-9]
MQHTIEVVQNVKYLCVAMNINQQETDMLIIAAWFHDTGFSVTYKGHEEESKLIATAFLKTQEFNIDFIDKICNCIDATKMPQCPTSKLAEILCDADVFHISNSHFFYRKLLLRKEWELFCDYKVSDLEWHKLNLDFLKKHHFRTTYGKDTLTSGKQENILKVERILNFY